MQVANERRREYLSAEEDLDGLPLPPMSRGPPLIGDFFKFATGPTQFALGLVDELGPVCRCKLFGFDCVFISGQDNLRRVLQEEADLLEMVVSKAQRFLMGPSSLGVLDGAEHARVRRLTYPSFTLDALCTHIPDIQAAAMDFFSKWAKQPSIKFSEEVKRFTLCVISHAIIGLDVAIGEDQLVKDFQSYFDGLFSFGINLGPLTKYGRAVGAKVRLVQSVNQGLEEGKRALGGHGGGHEGPKLLEKLQTFQDPETGERLTEDEIRDHVLFLMLAGYNTTADTLTHLLLQLGRNPEILTRLREEQAAVMAAHGPYMGPEALEAMTYAEACVKEVLRVTPPVLFPLRKVAREFEMEGVRVPVGWTAFPLIGHATQFEDGRWTGQQDTYNPNRFLTEDGRKPGAWMPFGLGPHTCLGRSLAIMESKIFLATLARHFDISIENLYPEFGLPPSNDPKDGMPVAVTRHIVK
ncbi:unnamed protein product [Ostreobium quekettii]|uniref:Cytochrome P450 n=1 Tax=Ostreobium quekettii TaxID=121088 RepID=A0A8S1JHU2_9CHLO|nr:unnamed protein product [Ostreobium quekettii]